MFFATTVAKGSTMAFPDVCKTPTPAGPIPVPYPNTASTMIGKPKSTKVKVCRAAPLMKNSKISMSNGDNAGVNGGVVSNSFMQRVEFTSASKKVRIQGKPALRIFDSTKANKGNTKGVVLAPSQSKVIFN